MQISSRRSGPARDSQVVQNLAYRFWLRDRRQDLHTALALWACQRVRHEHAFQKDGPGQSADSWHLRYVDVAGLALARLAYACPFDARPIWRGRLGRSRHHLGAILGRRPEDAVVSDEMAARAGDQRVQLLDQLVRPEHDVRRAITPNL